VSRQFGGNSHFSGDLMIFRNDVDLTVTKAAERLSLHDLALWRLEDLASQQPRLALHLPRPGRDVKGVYQGAAWWWQDRGI